MTLSKPNSGLPSNFSVLYIAVMFGGFERHAIMLRNTSLSDGYNFVVEVPDDEKCSTKNWTCLKTLVIENLCKLTHFS